MNSREKNARIVWRMKSVEVTRVIPSRWAASVASVDLPVPVAPPTRRRTGSSRCCSACSRRSRRIVRPPRARRAPRPRSRRAGRGRARARAAPDHVGVGATGELVGARRRQPRRGERPRHQPLRPRRALVAAERQRRQVAALAHTPTTALGDRLARRAARGARSRSGSPASGTTSLPGQDDRDPEPAACSATTSIAAALISTTTTSASRLRELLPQRGAVGEAPGDVDDVRAVDLARGARRSARAARPAPSRRTRSCGRARRRADAGAAPPARRARRAASSSRERRAPGLACVDAVLGHRDDDEVGEQRAVRVEVAGRDGRVLVRADDEDAPVGGDRRDRRAAAVEHDQVRVELLGEPRRPRRRSRARPRPRARRRSGGSRRSAARSAPRSRGGRRRRGGRRESARAGRRPSAGPRRARARPARRAPSRRRRRGGRARATRATCPVTAVFPTRLPVPITAIEGVPIGSKRGGSSRKSAPSYGTPSASDTRREPEARGRPEHGLVGEVEHDVGGVLGDRLLERGARAARRSRSPPRSFSVPPTSTHATTS